MAAKPELLAAAADMRLLLARGYPRRRVLEMCGDRYRLSADERHILRRGVFAPAEAASRRRRLLSLADLARCEVAIDGHNVLLTLETALSGGLLLAADDGVVRDISGRGRNFSPGPDTERAAQKLMVGLGRAGVRGALVYLDAPLSRSGELANRLSDMLAAAGLAGGARAVPVPEKLLRDFAGPVASSDSALIDRVARPLDLAGQIMATWRPPPPLERLL